MLNQNHASRVFVLCCVALTVTSMTFAIRAGILGELGGQYGLSATQLGWVNAMAFLGFPLATMFGGVLYNAMGAKRLISLAFVCHLLGLVLTIYSGGFWGLLISTFLIGFANGSVEAGCNPLIAEVYKDNKTTMLNKFHVWFPGGIVIGALISNAMTGMGLGWQLQVAVIIAPTLVYGYLLLTSRFPEFDRAEHSTINNVKHLFSPLYLFLVACMTLTATTELGTQQWIQDILGASGASPMLILALMTGIMAVGRFYAGPLIHRVNPTGVLIGSALFAALGMFLMSQVSGNLIYLAAILFALGVTYFWPTMLGCVSEYTPKTGALGLSLIGGAGMFAVSLWNPIIGSWIDGASADAQALNLPAEQVQILAGQAVLQNLIIFPCLLIIAFVTLHFVIKRRRLNRVDEGAAGSTL
ncbi:MFS transporter [Alteromonas oceanisediminis]|uniref:MFS transporter n=1 Tax=Alteromonas oceanisediminis TaxID=2836180 RepID=UPI001BD9EB2B|nr:MFS transporter [Alteromonas oceanisediminis]MBT0584984.1 MFS transporter [Alteromonas oceanisediminis]